MAVDLLLCVVEGSAAGAAAVLSAAPYSLAVLLLSSHASLCSQSFLSLLFISSGRLDGLETVAKY